MEGIDTLFVHEAALFRLTYILMNDNTDSMMLDMKTIEYAVRSCFLKRNETDLIGKFQGNPNSFYDGDVGFCVETA